MQIDPNYLQSVVTSLNNTTASEEQLTNELSSGLSVTSLESNPSAVGQSTLYSSAISRDDSYVQAATTSTALAQVTDSALGEVVTQLTQAISLGIEGANDTSNADNRSTIAGQISSIQDQVLSLANTSYLGQYVFAGSQGTTKPYTQDTSTTPATTTYNGDSAIQYTTTPTGQKIQTNLAGSSVFGASGANVFTALNTLAADLSGGASSATLQADTAAVSTALQTVTTQRNVIDNSLTQLQSTGTYTQTSETQLEALQSSLVSANTPSVVTQLSGLETQGQALMSVISTLEKNSLFDYLR
jgi:flagellar hook-associated protein 3 FlgL